MKDLYIVGAGGMGRELLNIILDIHKTKGERWRLMGFLDDTEHPLKDKDCDLTVVGSIQNYYPKNNDALAMGIADPEAKRKISGLLKARGAHFETIVSPGVNGGRHNEVGEGVVFYPGFAMTVNCKIGNFCTLLTCGIGHDCIIGDFCTISSLCNIMGGANVGSGVYMGGNCVIAPHTHIGDNAYLCLGSVVLKDVKAGSKVMGNPAREIG